MKNYFILGCVAFFGLFLMACQSLNSVKESSISKDLKREWKVVAFGAFSKEQLTKADATLNLTDTKTNKDQYGAFFGCNKMFFILKQKGNTLMFGNVGSTMMYCEGMMDLESAAAQFLQGEKTYEISGHYLTIKNPEGKTMKLIAVDWD